MADEGLREAAAVRSAALDDKRQALGEPVNRP